ncbi:MAG TPA: hypothetical protein VF389_11645 [Woeseiaceae bacterium]
MMSALKAGASFVTSYWKVIVGTVAGIAIGFGIGFFVGRGAGKDAVLKDVAEASLEVAAEVAASHDVADVERSDDETATEDRRKDRDDAIRNAEGGDALPSATSDALNCQRLREHGIDTAHIPACG